MGKRAGEHIQGTGKALRRRGLIAGAAALVAGLLAKQAAEESPVAADNGTWTFPYAGTANAPVAFSVTNGSGKAIYGTSAFTAGVHGNTAAPNGSGSSGVYGSATNDNTSGVLGYTTAAGMGITGQADAAGGIGVKGTSANGTAMSAQTTGAANANAAVLGVATKGPGVQGQSTGYYGLVGFTSATDGHSALIGYANATGGIGLIGNAPGGTSPGLAGVFNGDVIVNGALRVYGSPKNAAVKHPDSTYRLLYCEESPESWFADYGRGTLANGKAEIKLDPDFAALVHVDDYHVFLTEYGGHSGLYVADTGPVGFTVQAQEAAGTGGPKAPTKVSGTFSWRVVAKRKDIAGERLAKVAPPPPVKPITPFTVPETPEPKPPTKKP